MQPFDDLLPAETDPQNEEVLTFLRQSHGIAELSAAEPDPQQKAQALAAVRQRLLETRQAQLVEETAQPSVRHVPLPSELIQAPVLSSRPETRTAHRRQWARGMALLAAALCAVALVGSLLTVFSLIKRGAQYPRPRTQVSTQAASHSLYIVTQGWLQKVDAATGALIWQAQLPHRQHSDAPPTNFPLIGNGVVYVTVDNTVLAFNATRGNPLWLVVLPDGSADAGGMFVQPVLAHGRLYVALEVSATASQPVEIQLDALDASSGQMLWSYRPVGMIEELAVADATVYASVHLYSNTNRKDELVALDATDGSQKWDMKRDVTHAATAAILNADSHLVVQNGIIYQLLYSSACSEKGGDCIFAYRADSGALLWHSPNLVPAFAQQNEFDFWFEGDLIAAGNALYIDSIGGLYAIDASHGQLLWRQPEGSMLTSKPANHSLSDPFAGKGNPGVSFVVAGGTIFHMEMTGQGNYLATLQTGTGKVIAREHIENFVSSLLAQISIKTKQYVGFLTLEGLMTATISYVFPSPGHLDALDNRTGARLWSLPLAGGGSAVLTLASP